MKLYPKIQKKRGDCPLLAPRFEALGLPTLSKRATMTPRRYANITPAKFGRCTLITYPWASIVAEFIDKV